MSKVKEITLERSDGVLQIKKIRDTSVGNIQWYK